MSKLKITEDLTGTQIGFPMSGMPATSTEGKLYRGAFWACIMLTSTMSSFDSDVWGVLIIVAAIAMLVLAIRSRKLTLYLDHRVLQIRAPWKRRAVPLEGVCRFERIKDDHASMFYLLAHTETEAITASTLLSKSDAERLQGILEAAHARRISDAQHEPARPPEALRALMGQAQKLQ